MSASTDAPPLLTLDVRSHSRTRATGLSLACGLGQKTLLLMLVRRAHAQNRPAVGALRHLPARLRASPPTR